MNTDKDSNNMITGTKPLYARIAVLLLALNFIVNGYVLYHLTKMQTEQVSDAPVPAQNQRAASE